MSDNICIPKSFVPKSTCCSKIPSVNTFNCSLLNVTSVGNSLRISRLNDCLFNLELLVKDENTATVELIGEGNTDNPLQANVLISAASDNSISILEDGLYANPAQESDPAFSDDIFG